jgi:hypothetical protein
MCWIPPENADEQKDTTRTEFATAMARIHFLVLAQVYTRSVNVTHEMEMPMLTMGFLGSFSIHSTT